MSFNQIKIIKLYHLYQLLFLLYELVYWTDEMKIGIMESYPISKKNTLIITISIKTK